MTTTDLRCDVKGFTPDQRPLYAYYVIAHVDGERFRHFHDFANWQEGFDEDGSLIIIDRDRIAFDRARRLQARIDAALATDDVYGLDRKYWIPVAA